MFEKQLAADLKEIFGFKKVTYRTPDDAEEQEVLFVEVARPNARIRDGIQQARVEARCTVYVQQDKMPFGFFQKAIAAADPKISKRFFFFDIDQNARTFGDLGERTLQLVYFFNSQFDPDNGTLNAVTIEVET